MLTCVDTGKIGMSSYERVAESIRQRIRSGDLKPNDKLPGNRDLAERYDVALGTAQKALRALQDTGWVTSTPSVGVFVNEPPDEAAEAATLETVVRQVAELRATVDDLTQRVKRVENDNRPA